jgi:hypothetical protein
MESIKETMNETMKENDIIEMYLNQLTPFQITANEIAKEKLGSSYCVDKSIGFLEFKKEFDKKIENQVENQAEK